MNLDENDILLHEESKILQFPECAEEHDGIGPFNDVNLPGVWFYKIPHKVPV